MTNKVVQIIGVKKLRRDLRKAKRNIEKGIERGLKAGGLYLQRLSQLIVPIDTSALKNSARTIALNSGADTEVLVQYLTAYAIYVHEDLHASHAPGKVAKFLEKPAIENRRDIIRVVWEEAKRR